MPKFVQKIVVTVLFLLCIEYITYVNYFFYNTHLSMVKDILGVGD